MMNQALLGAGLGVGIALSTSMAMRSETTPIPPPKPVAVGHVKKQKEKVREALPPSRKQLDDPINSRNWGLAATGATRSWGLSRGSKKIVVAVIDTGIDSLHPDLRENLWRNTGEIPDNGVDDDRNGFVDDVHGWNFVNDDADLTDRHGHGTHIAGIIGAVGGNDHGLSGISPSVSLMVLKYFDPKFGEEESITRTVRAIDYAVMMGANVINYSAGGTSPNRRELAAIDRARERGVLFVAAAGNEAKNSDVFRYYPADYGLSNILSVTAVDPLKRVLPSSNYGVTTVHIAAPGEDILSTLPGGRYGYMTGTSQATAFASGAAALLFAKQPSLIGDPERVIEHLVQSGELNDSLLGKTRARKVLNAFRALAIEGEDTAATGIMASNSGGLDPRLFVPGFASPADESSGLQPID